MITKLAPRVLALPQIKLRTSVDGQTLELPTLVFVVVVLFIWSKIEDEDSLEWPLILANELVKVER